MAPRRPRSARRAGPVRPGDGRALVAVGVQFFVNGAVFATFVPRLPEIRDRVGVDVRVLGALLAGAGVAGLAASAMAGPAVARLGSRRVMVGATAATAALLPVVGLVRSPVPLLAVLAALSALDVLVDVAMNLQGSWLSARRRTPVVNRLHGLWSLGTVSGGLAAAAVAAGGVPTWAHFSATALVIGAAAAVVHRGALRTDEHLTAPPPTTGTVATAWSLPALAAAGAFALVVEITTGDWAAFRLADDLGASPGTAGLAYVAFTSGMTFGRLAGDAVQRALGGPGLFRLAIGVAGIGVVAASILPAPGVTLVAYAVAGLGVAPLFPRLYDTAARRPGRAGAGLGALSAGSRLAGLVAPAAVGALAATELSVGAATLAVTLPAVVGLAVVGSGRQATPVSSAEEAGPAAKRGSPS